MTILPLKTPLKARLLTKDHCAPIFSEKDGQECLIIGMDDGEVPEIGFNCEIQLLDRTINRCNFNMWLELIDLHLAPETHSHKDAATAWLLVESAKEAHKDNFWSKYYIGKESVGNR